MTLIMDSITVAQFVGHCQLIAIQKLPEWTEIVAHGV